MITRLVVLNSLKPKSLKRFFAYHGHLAVLGLLYIIIVLFASQVNLVLYLFKASCWPMFSKGKRIIDDIGTVVRICVPLVLYFTIVWTSTFFSFWAFSRTKRGASWGGYEKAVTQAFTAGSNNVRLFAHSAHCLIILLVWVGYCRWNSKLWPKFPWGTRCYVRVASFFVSKSYVRYRMGPLIEVPVLLSLSYLALWLRDRMDWAPKERPEQKVWLLCYLQERPVRYTKTS